VLCSMSWLLRLPLLVIPVVSLVLIGRFLRGWYGVLAALLLATSIPFYYYSVGVRGYGLSMMLFLFMLHFVEGHRYVWTAITTALFVYVMPSNVAFVLGVLVMLCLRRITRKPALISILLGAVVGTIMYLPLIPAMRIDPQVMAHDSYWRILTESFPQVAWAFLSYRFLLVPFVLYEIIKCRGFVRDAAVVTIVSCSLFLISGNYLWARVLLPLLPLWCIATATILTEYQKEKGGHR